MLLVNGHLRRRFARLIIILMILRFLSKLFDVLAVAISTLLLLRFVFRLFSAAPTAPFVMWLYQFTGSALEPFRGIFPTPSIITGSYVDIPALIAAGVYFGAGYLISSLIDSLADNLKIGMRTKSQQHIGVQNPLPQSQYQPPVNQVQQDPNQNPPIK